MANPEAFSLDPRCVRRPNSAMTAPESWIDKRMVNALCPEARIGGAAGGLLGRGARFGIGKVEQAMGGLWVGGTAYLTQTGVEFHPNALNRAVHASGSIQTVRLPLAEIEHVAYRKAMVTHIVDLAAGEARLSIRGYDMRAFHAAIAQAVERARAGSP